MMRLHVLCEGPSEERFVAQLLAPHLAAGGVWAIGHAVLTRKDDRRGRVYKGGLAD